MIESYIRVAGRDPPSGDRQSQVKLCDPLLLIFYDVMEKTSPHMVSVGEFEFCIRCYAPLS